MFPISVFVKLLFVQTTVSQVLYQDFRNHPSLLETTRRFSRQTNNLMSNIIPNGLPFQNVLYGNGLPIAANNMVQNVNSVPLYIATQQMNNMPVEKLLQTRRGINSNEILNLAASSINNFNNLKNLLTGNNFPISNNLLFGTGIPNRHSVPVINLLPSGYNEQIFNGFQNIQTANKFINNGASPNLLPNMNSVSLANIPLNLLGGFNVANTKNLQVNNLSKNNNMLIPNLVANSPHNNLPIDNRIQNLLNFPVNNILPSGNNMLFTNGKTNLPMNNMAVNNAIGNMFNTPVANDVSNNNSLLNELLTSYFLSNRVSGINNYQLANGKCNINNGVPVANNNIPTINSVPYNNIQGSNINDPFTISSNIPLQTIIPRMNDIPRNVINNNVPLWNNGITANEGLFAVDKIPINGFLNLPIANNFPISNNVPIYNNLPATISMPFLNNWQNGFSSNNLPN